MRNFSIAQDSSQSVIEQYSDFLLRDVYENMQPYDVNDPLFLQQLGVLQAEGIRRAVNTNSAVTYGGFQETNTTIANSTNLIGNKIGSVANMLTSSLDKGFSILNNSLVKIDSGIDTANTHLSNIHSGINTVNAGIDNVNKNLNALGNVVGKGFAALDSNLFALRNMVGQGFSKLYAQLCMSNDLLEDILTELKIPETQRERRYHIEEATKYLAIALAKGDKLYFEDAFDEFNKAIAIERKDFFSWFNLGIIYLRSTEHIDIPKSISAFERFVHYAQAEVMHRKNQNLEYQIEEAHLYMAESYYLQQKSTDAISETEHCILLKDKADFMKVKYLSATNENNNKQEAAKILSQLIDKNPYITLQVLEDDDIVKNDCIIKLLEKLRQDTVKKANTLLLAIRKNLKNSYSIEQTKDKIREIENLLQKQTFLESYEAIYLMGKEYEWWERNEIVSFTSSILEFENKEKQALIEAEEMKKEIKQSKAPGKKGNDLIFERKYEEAIKYFSAAIKVFPNETFYYISKSNALEALQRYEEAIECFDIVIKLNPMNPNVYDPYNRKSFALISLKRYEEAIKCLDAAIKIHPNHPYFYSTKGVALEALERFEEAIKCFDTAYKLNPQFTYCLDCKKRLLEKLGKR